MDPAAPAFPPLHPTTPPPPETTPEPESPPPKPAAISGLTAVVLMFSLGFFGSITASRFLVPPPSPPAPTGQLLGAVAPTAVPTPIPTPDPNLYPETLDQPFSGTLAYLLNGQIYTIKADRTNPLQISQDGLYKSHLVASPDQITLAYTYQDTETSDTPRQGISLVNRQTKAVTELVKPQSATYAYLAFSGSGRYLSAWNTNGQEAIVIDTLTAQTAASFGTESQGGISPMVWLPGSETVSFILDNELFTRDLADEDLFSLASNVVAIKSTADDQDIPLPPVWSADGTYVAYVKPNGLYLFHLPTAKEIAVLTSDQDFELDTLPYRALAFNQPLTHLLYESPANAENQTLYAYSVAEIKSVPIGVSSPSTLMDTATNQVLNLINTSGGSQLTKYSLTSWSEATCTDQLLSYPLPPSTSLLNPLDQALVSLTHQGDLYTLKLVETESCQAYDLVKSLSPLANPIWLTN
ncbi:hypothetical protein A2W24_02730 [Microgenomates group bacterium RBG_16_45_19]|nr:MAG: hypothetical protein A2W24_02730 [Microgenomates group bacterium RBG_16_45_19]